MKQKHFPLLLLFFIITTVSFAQQSNVFTKDVLTVSPESTQNNKVIRNPNATSVNVHGIIVDKRASKYYNQEDFNDMSLEDAKKINFIYIDSYELKTPKAELGNVCLDKIKNELDLGDYTNLRKYSERVVTTVKLAGCEFKISLYSWEEIKNFK